MEVYADHAATTRMCPAAVEAMVPCFREVYGNPSSQHSLGQRAREQLEQARAQIGACIGASGREIFFTSGGSEADNQAILSCAALGAKQGKKHIITTAFEHPAVLQTLESLKNQGFSVTYLEVSPENHNVSPESLQNALQPDTCLVTAMYANNEIGSILPIREMGKICKEAGVLFHVDAVQAVGQIPVDVRENCIDLLSLSAHKFGGPKGIGALYARRGISLTSLVCGGGQERGKRAGTENVPGALGMAAALQEACSHMEENSVRVKAMADRLIRDLSQIPGSYLNGDPVSRLPGIVSFSFQGIEGESLLLLLDQKGICASAGSACSSGSLETSHVLRSIGREASLAKGTLRLSLGSDNREEEIDYLLEQIPGIIADLRALSSQFQES